MGLFWPHAAQVNRMAGMGPGERSSMMEVMPYGHTAGLLLMTAFRGQACYIASTALYG